MIFQPFSGAFYLVRGIRLLFQPGVRLYVIVPLLINFIVFSLLIWLGIAQFETLVDKMMASLPGWLQWLDWLIWPLFIIALLLIGFTFSLQLANLIAAPFTGPLSAAIERRLLPDEPPATGGWLDIVKEALPALINEGRKFAYFLIRALPLGILFLIPGINIVAPFIWIAFSAWILALEYIDIPMANHGIYFKELRGHLKQRRFLALGFGGTALAMSIIPLVNFFAMPVAVAGATLLYVEQFRHTIRR